MKLYQNERKDHSGNVVNIKRSNNNLNFERGFSIAAKKNGVEIGANINSVNDFELNELSKNVAKEKSNVSVSHF